MSLWRYNKKNTNVIIQENPQECIKLVEQEMFVNVFTTNVTDISYNGQTFFALDNEIGRYQLKMNYTQEEVFSFIKKIANYMLKPFSNKNQSIDVSFGDYRLNAIHPSIGRNNNNRVVTFSLRKISAKLKIIPFDENLCQLEIHYFLSALMSSHESILISGKTGSGKTEFQKYLVSLMNQQDRIILIEESYETHIKEIYPKMDVTSWIVDNEHNQLGNLVKTSLRNNPDWIMIAEIRGVEAYDMVQAILTGHSAITTIHSEGALYTLNRLCNMCKNRIDIDEKMFLSNISNHIKIGIHLEKIFDEKQNKYIRRIQEIVEYIPSTDGFTNNVLYKVERKNGKDKYTYGKMSEDLKNKLLKENINIDLLKNLS